MKTKIVWFLLTVCVLLAFRDNMSADAGKGKLTKLGKLLTEYNNKFARCCRIIECVFPKRCVVVMRGQTNCMCINAKQVFH